MQMLLLHCSLVSDSSLNGQATSDIIYSLVLDRPSSKTQSAQWPTRPRSLGSRCNSPAQWPTRPRSLGSRCNSPAQWPKPPRPIGSRCNSPAQWPTLPRSLGSRCNSPAQWPTRPRSLGSRCNSPTIQARTYVPRNTAGDSLLGNLFKIAGKTKGDLFKLGKGRCSAVWTQSWRFMVQRTHPSQKGP